MHIKLTLSGLENDLSIELIIQGGVRGLSHLLPGGIMGIMKVEERFSEEIALNFTAGDFKPIFDLVTASTVRLFVPGPTGLDGVTFTLTFSEDFSSSEFKWWVKAGDGWGPLDQIAREILALAGRKAGREFPLLEN